ncbi:hypothetical protein [Spiroplasma endosymbiont of Tipula paludosa]|uniref:hypothetical protein n=1 Tax=Spiroplasma endosymbiont of Tipula paludosa TaxID=3066295 RepID=UPI0035C8F896
MHLTLQFGKQKQIGGRPNKLSIEQRLLMTLEYWKEYKTWYITITSLIQNYIFLKLS